MCARATPHDEEDSGDDGPSSRRDIPTQVEDVGTVVEQGSLMTVQFLNTKIRELE